MKIVFFGGGGLRTIPLARAMLARVPDLRGGEITLYDLDPQRLEAVELVLRQAPEFAAADCTLSRTTSLDEALPGADMVNLSLMAGSPLAYSRSQAACSKLGFIGSDQISPCGAFLGLKSGKIALDLARRMEAHCPQAWLTDFANPVPVVSAVVNNHTRIRALGICAGFVNHQWDLTRLQGRDEQDEGYDVDVAGVNHGSLILRGTYRGEDLWQIFDRILAEGFQEPEYHGYADWAESWLHWGVPRLLEVYRKHGCTIFSTERDGMHHYFYEEMWERAADARAASLRVDLPAQAEAGREARIRADREFQELAQGELPGDYWETHQRDDSHIQTRIAAALGGGGEQKIVASFPCGGRVEGFKDRTVLEYSMYLGPEGIRPVPDLAVPEVFHGLVTALATHQTLLGDAIATEDPQVLYQALLSYPVHQNTRAYWTLCEALLEINREEIAAAFQGAPAYFW